MEQQTIDLSTLSASELTQLAKQLADQGKHKRALEKAEKERKAAEKKAAHAAMMAALGDGVREMAETVVAYAPYEETGLWAGYKASSIPLEIDGEQFTVSLSVTHVARKKELKAAAEAEAVAAAQAALDTQAD